MKWAYMIAAAAAAALFFGVAPRIAFPISLILLAASFASFCLLHDEPMRRATARIAGLMAHISSKGAYADQYQRLQSMKIVPNEQDKAFRWTFLSSVNFFSGCASFAMLLWGLIARIW